MSKIKAQVQPVIGRARVLVLGYGDASLALTDADWEQFGTNLWSKGVVAMVCRNDQMSSMRRRTARLSQQGIRRVIFSADQYLLALRWASACSALSPQE